MPSPIVTTDWLADHLDDPSLAILEVSADLDDTTYAAGHIPGAVRWFWKDLCWHDTDRQFVTPEALAERLGGIGISEDTTLVLYGDPVQYGTYALWSLTMAGHPDLRLLDGTRTKWIAEGRELSTERPETAPAAYQAQAPNAAMRVGRDDVRDNLAKPGRLLLDLRSPEEYSGERVSPPPNFDHGAERKGRIPGAVNLYYMDLMTDDDAFKTAEDLRRLFAAVGADRDVDEIVCYCRLSHRATFAWTAMTCILGYENVKIYDGSWTEWGSIVGFPVEG